MGMLLHNMTHNYNMNALKELPRDNIDPKTLEVIKKACSPDRSERYKDAKQMLEALTIAL